MGTRDDIAEKSGPWVDLSLTLPVFLGYQLGVVFLNVRNATDIVTAGLLALTHGDRLLYLALTGAIAVTMAAFFALLGRGQALRFGKLVQIAFEGAAYAAAMGSASSWVIGKLFAARAMPAAPEPIAAVVMSLGAGFYEEVAFRAVLFGLGARLLVRMAAGRRAVAGQARRVSLKAAGVTIVWAVVCAAVFSAMHYVGPLGDAFDPRSFVARGVLGLALTLIYKTRGFAAAVWTHALYDVWVLVL